MKSEIVTKEKKKENDFIHQYPCLGLFEPEKNFVVLFTAYKEGVVVNSSHASWTAGEYRTDWVMEMFIKLPDNQVINLSN